MIIEWECILNCNFKCEYCLNSRNSALIEPIYFEKDKVKVMNFIEELKKKYPNEELFLFGGEPFSHPFIEDIIKKLNEVKMKFIIQTNGFYIDKILSIESDFKLQVSVHPSQINNIENYKNNLLKIKDKIRRLDIMFYSNFYEVFKCLNKDFSEVIVTKPVAGFLGAKGNVELKEFNKLKKTVHGKVFKFEEGERSFIWEDQMNFKCSPKGKPCMYKDVYVLFDPMLNKYNCSYRQNNEICPNDHCFLM